MRAVIARTSPEAHASICENDPLFREAFAQLSNDPKLAEWFRAEQEFDAVMAEKFRNVPVEQR